MYRLHARRTPSIRLLLPALLGLAVGGLSPAVHAQSYIIDPSANNGFHPSSGAGGGSDNPLAPGNGANSVSGSLASGSGQANSPSGAAGGAGNGSGGGTTISTQPVFTALTPEPGAVTLFAGLAVSGSIAACRRKRK